MPYAVSDRQYSRTESDGQQAQLEPAGNFVIAHFVGGDLGNSRNVFVCSYNGDCYDRILSFF